MTRLAAVALALVVVGASAAATAPQPHLQRPYAIVVEGGTVYVGDGETGRLIQVDLRTRRSRLIARGLGVITGVDLDARGNLHVSDIDGGRVVRLGSGA